MTDKRKKSWREIDAGRDRSGGSGRAPSDGRSPDSKLKDVQKSKQYRAALDALFEKGGFDKVAEVLGKSPGAPSSLSKPAEPAAEAKAPAAAAAPAPAPKPVDPADATRQALKKKILEAIGREEITRAIDKYAAKWPLPAEWEVLEQALEHTDRARVEEAIGTMELMVAREKPRRARALLGKLRFIEETMVGEELAKRAAALRGKLG
jgi:hypothetical protein